MKSSHKSARKQAPAIKPASGAAVPESETRNGAPSSIAAKYADIGLAPICIHKGGKIPIAKGWQTAPVDAAAVDAWIDRGGNVGLRMGAQPDGRLLVALDEDEPGALARAEAQLGALPATLTARTGGGGQHRIYEWPAVRALPKNNVRKIAGIDLRSQGGQIVVAPSRSAKGEYAWTIVQEITALPAGWCDALDRDASKASSSTPRDPDAPANDARLARAHALACVLPVSVSHHGGDDAMNRAAIRLAAELDCDVDATDRVLADVWDPLCAPPWVTEAGGREKLRRAAERACAHVATERDALRGVSSALARHGAAARERAAHDDDGASSAHAPPEQGTPAGLLRHGRMADRSKLPDPLEYVIEGLDLAPGKVSAIQAFANVAKTPFALLMSICVAAGKPFLGFDVKQRNALFLAFEGGTLTEEREARLCAGLGLDRAAVPLHFMHVDSSVATNGFLDDLAAYIEEQRIGFVAIDTYGSSLPGDIEHNSNKFAHWLKELGKVSDVTGALIVALLHENKSTSATGLHKMSGHNSAPAAVQAAISLERTSDDRTVIDVSCSREVRKAFAPFRVQFTDAPCEGAPTGKALRVARTAKPSEAVGKRPQDERRTQEAQAKTIAAGHRIWDVLRDNQNHATRDLVSAGGEGTRPAERAVARLVDAKFAVRTMGAIALTETGAAAPDTDVRDAIAGTKTIGRFARPVRVA